MAHCASLVLSEISRFACLLLCWQIGRVFRQDLHFTLNGRQGLTYASSYRFNHCKEHFADLKLSDITIET